MEQRGRRVFGTVALAFALSAGAGAGWLANHLNPRAVAVSDPNIKQVWVANPGTTSVPKEYFVRPQPAALTPYGTPIAPVKRGEPSKIALTSPASQTCDLQTSTLTRSVTVLDEAGEPVSGAPVLFQVRRVSDGEIQLVGDTTDYTGQALVTVSALRATGGPQASYHVEALLDTDHGIELTMFDIADFTCSAATAE
ncbi:MAG: Ig-like domain-containing protein [Cellulomonadaceae bacterium]|jgi:hypothetical protein|nr:Ig-like domain-containing protein [Cellulomonadaceae bacterium]